MNFLSKLAPMADASTTDTSSLAQIINTVNNVLTAALGLLTTGVIILAIVIAYKFFTASDKDKRANAKAQLIYAIIGVVVLVALLIFAPTITSAVENALSK